MKYYKELPSQDFAQACGLDNKAKTRLHDAIMKAYDQEWHKDGPNIDQINAVVAPYIHTPEEGFYAATIILTDVFGSIMEGRSQFN